MLGVGEDVGCGRTGIRHVDEVEAQLRGNQVWVVARRAPGPNRRTVGTRPDARTRRHRAAECDVPAHSEGLDACAQNLFGIRPACRAKYPAVTAAAIAAAIVGGSAA